MKWQNKIVMPRRNEKISASHTVYKRWIIVRISKRLRTVARLIRSEIQLLQQFLIKFNK